MSGICQIAPKSVNPGVIHSTLIANLEIESENAWRLVRESFLGPYYSLPMSAMDLTESIGTIDTTGNPVVERLFLVKLYLVKDPLISLADAPFHFDRVGTSLGWVVRGCDLANQPTHTV